MFKGKMKKFVGIIGVLVLMLSLVACGDTRTAQEKEAVNTIMETAVRIDVQYGFSFKEVTTVKKLCTAIFYRNQELFRLTVAENGEQKQGDFGREEYDKLKDIIVSLQPVANENFADEEEIASMPEDHGFIVVYYLVDGKEEPEKRYFRVSDTKKLNEYIDELSAQCK
ncbi:MAG: hypothetical protein IJS16_07985 [Butyrivibrio sp.]|nr:hypothetical protein [Butyrivibrio sp.]